MNRPERSCNPFLLIRSRVRRPAVGNDACVDARDPDMRFGELGIELAGLAKQLARPQVMVPGDVMKMPGAAPHQVPGGHVAGVTRGGFGTLTFEQLRFGRPRDPFGNLILDCEHLSKFEIVPLSPEMVA